MKRQNFKKELNLLMKYQKIASQEGGYVLVVVMGMVLSLSGLFLTSGFTSKVDQVTSRATEESSSGFYAAEAGLNLRSKKIKDIFVGYDTPEGTSPDGNSVTVCRDANANNNGTEDYKCEDSSFGKVNGKPIPVSTYLVPAKGDNGVVGSVSNVKIGPNEEFPGLDAQEYKYDVTSVAFTPSTLSGQTPQPIADLKMRFKSRLVPLFQFAAFYDKDLEILPSPPMVLTGPVHANGNLYLQGNAGLRLQGQVSLTGSLFRGRKDTSACAGTVFVANGIGTQEPGMVNPCTARTQVTDVSPWKGRVKLNMPKLTVPPPETLDPSPTAQYWQKADLRVVLKLNPSTKAPEAIEIRKADGTTDSARTDRLRDSCPVSSTTLRNAANSNAQNLDINAITAPGAEGGFRVNDRLVIGNDFDSNAIFYQDGQTEPNKDLTLSRFTTAASSTTTPLNITFTGASTVNRDTIINPRLPDNTSKIQLRRQLGQEFPDKTPVRRAVVSTSDTFYNNRERKRIRMLDVDVQALLDCIHDQDLQDPDNSLGGIGKRLDDQTEGGLVWFFSIDDDTSPNVSSSDGSRDDINVYASGNNPVDGNNYGVRLYNGNILKSTLSGAPEIKGLTVVSDQAVYIRGHYNCEARVVTENQPPTCFVDKSVTPHKPSKKPAAILADSINILSENWRMSDFDSEKYNNDRIPKNSPDPKKGNGNEDTTRVARHTNINAAFLSGSDTTGRQEGSAGAGSGTYNGGLENYPRFHEDWSPQNVGDISYTVGGTTTPSSQVALSYLGSFVSLNRPRRVDGPWGDAQYDPPFRIFGFDEDFRTASKLPPLSPRFVYLRQERFSRDFEQQASFSMPKFFASIFPWVAGKR
jgi:hypothetical protein